MTDPVDGFDRALAVALTPPDELRARGDAGARVRARAHRRRTARATAAATGIVAVVALLVVAVGGLVRSAGPNPPNAITATGSEPRLGMGNQSPPVERAYGPGGLKRPIEVVEVHVLQPTPCPTFSPGPDSRGVTERDGSCLSMARQAILTIKQVVGLDVITDRTTGPGVVVRLVPADAATLGAFSRKHVGGRVAFVVDQRIWSVPQLASPIDGGVVMIPVGSGRDDAQDLVRTLRFSPATGPAPASTR